MMIWYHYEAISRAVQQWWISRFVMLPPHMRLQFCAINADGSNEKRQRAAAAAAATAAAEQTVYAVC